MNKVWATINTIVVVASSVFWPNLLGPAGFIVCFISGYAAGRAARALWNLE